MASYKQEVNLIVKSIIRDSEMLIKQAKKLEQACQLEHQNYDVMYAAMHSMMDYNNNIGTKMGEMSVL